MKFFTGAPIDLEENAGFKRPPAIFSRVFQIRKSAICGALNSEHRVNQTMNRQLLPGQIGGDRIDNKRHIVIEHRHHRIGRFPTIDFWARIVDT